MFKIIIIPFTEQKDFGLDDRPRRQVEGLLQEYPQARVSQYVIYCTGNQGWRVFETGGE